MPNIEINGVNLHYTDEGPGSLTAPQTEPLAEPLAEPETIVFSHGLLLDGSIFADQIAHLKNRYRCITYDHRGQGASELASCGFEMDELAVDAASLIEALDLGPCHFVGHSMGGFVGMRLAMARPDLLKSLILINSSAAPETFAKSCQYKVLNFIARNFGLEVVVDRVMPIMFGQTYLKDPARIPEHAIWRDLVLKNDRETITRAVQGAVDRACMRDKICNIGHPTLIIVGEEDITTPPDKAREMHRSVKNSQLVLVPKAGHISMVEEPLAVNTAIEGFLGRV